MCCTFGGGIVGLAGCYIFFGGKINIPYITLCILGSMASIAGSCYLVRMWESLCIGLMSGILTFVGLLIVEQTTYDDPCGAFIVHGLNGIWGLIAVGIFGKPDNEIKSTSGLLYGGK